MGTEDSEKKDSTSGPRNTSITGNKNSGIIAGGDILGGVTFGPPPLEDRALEAAPAPQAPAVRIPFLGANPQGAPALRLDHEVREIDLALRRAEFRERFDLHQQLAVRSVDLQRIISLLPSARSHTPSTTTPHPPARG